MRMIKLADAAKEVTIIDGKLMFGEHEAQHCSFIREDSVAALYMLRYKNEYGHWIIISGLDLVGDKFWLGSLNTRFYQNQSKVVLPSAYYDSFTTIAKLIDTIGDTQYKEWAIFEEEDFDKQYEDFLTD